MDTTEKLDFILKTFEAVKDLIPKTGSVVLDSDDDKLHQLLVRIKVAEIFAKGIVNYGNYQEKMTNIFTDLSEELVTSIIELSDMYCESLNK